MYQVKIKIKAANSKQKSSADKIFDIICYFCNFLLKKDKLAHFYLLSTESKEQIFVLWIIFTKYILNTNLSYQMNNISVRFFLFWDFNNIKLWQQVNVY